MRALIHDIVKFVALMTSFVTSSGMPMANRNLLFFISSWCLLFSFLFFLPIISANANQNHPREYNEVVAVFPENFPPQCFLDEKGKPAGFAIDVLDQVARLANLKVVYRAEKSWVDASNALLNGTADLIPNSGITAKRLIDSDFTIPVETFAVVIFVREATDDIKSLADLKGRKVAVLPLNVGKKIVDGQKNIKGVVYNEISTAFFDLLAGKVDAFIYPKPVALKLARDAGIDGNIKIVGENLAEIKRAIRVRKGDKLLARLNPAVNEFLRSPEYKKIYGKWYGEPEPFLSIRRLTVASAVLLVTITVSLLLWRFNTIQKLNREQEHIIDERTEKLIEANTLLQKEIGERKKKEKALLRSENGLKEAQHLGKMGSWELEFTSDKLYWSDEIYRIFEVDKNDFEATYQAFLDHVYPEDREFVQNAFDESVQNGKPYEIIHRILTANDKLKYVEEIGKTFYDEAGNAIRSVGTVQDITLAKQSEELLKRETARSQFLLDLYLKSNVLNDSEVYEYVMDEAVKLTDSKIGYLHVINEDQQTITLTLWNKEALKECTTVSDNHHPIVKGGIWADSIRQKKLVIHNTYQSHPDKKGYPEGHSHLTRHMSVPVLEEDQVRLVFGVGNKSQNYDESDVKTLQIVANELQKIIVQRHSIEQRRTLEAQLRQTQKMEAIGTLAGGIAHDFNNILTAIIGYTEITIGDLAPDSRAASDLQQVLNAGNRAKELVKQILSFSRQAEQELQPLRPQLLVKEALKLLRSSIPTTIEVKENIDPECGAVLADPTQIHQIIMNLCTNAYHAMRETGGVLGVSVTPVELGSDDLTTKMHLTAGIYVRFEVSDTGCGMDKIVLEKIFDPYYTTKGKKEGTGLGLSVVHGIVKSLHGDITVYSSLGEGTTFRVYIPMVDTEAKKVLQAATTRQLPSGDEHVLIVDDDEAIVKMEEQMLKSFGYQVSAFSRCEEALNAFRSHPDAFDLIITDMTMPGITGLQLTREVLALRSDMPVILCTGFSELINEKKAKDAGICRYLMKPLLKKDLAIAVREVLDKKAKKQIL